jgi:hypothetical protein
LRFAFARGRGSSLLNGRARSSRATDGGSCCPRGRNARTSGPWFLYGRTRSYRGTHARAGGSRTRGCRFTNVRTSGSGMNARARGYSAAGARSSCSRVRTAGTGGYRRTNTMTRSDCWGTNVMPRSRYRVTDVMPRTGLMSWSRYWRTDAMEALIPASPLAAMVFIIKILVITLTNPMSAPIGILLFESPPVMRVALIPCIPLRRIPDLGSDNIGGRIRIIRGPAILIAEELIQYAI